MLTLLSVKMTERDMRQRSHRGGLLGRYYHSSGSLEKLTPCITNWDWTARPLITWCSFQRHANRIFFFLSMNQWLHPMISVMLPPELHAFESFDKSATIPLFCSRPSRTPPPFQLRSFSWTLLVCSVMAKQYFSTRETSNFVFFKSCPPSNTHHTPKSSFLPLLILPAPHPSTLLPSTDIHTYSGLMHFIKEATCGE